MTTHATLDSQATALLVMDYQNGVISRLPEAGALLTRVEDAIATVRAEEGHVGYVRRFPPPTSSSNCGIAASTL